MTGKLTAKFKDSAGTTVLNWYNELKLETANELCEKIRKAIKSIERENKDLYNILWGAAFEWFSVRNWASWPESERPENKWPKQRTEAAERIRTFLQFGEDFGQMFQIGWLTEEFAFLYMGNPTKGIFVPDPNRYLDIIQPTDFGNITPAALRAQLSAPRNASDFNVVPAEAEHSLTINVVQSSIDKNEEDIRAKKEEIEDARHAKTGELKELQEKIEALEKTLRDKKEALMAKLNAELENLENQKELLDNQIYMLDSQIYAIRCYAGEIVHFTKVRSGKPAPVTEPIIVHQKLRFLDEDLGRMASIYSIDWDDIGMFEHFLKYHPLAVETFAPDQKCVTLIRVSRTAGLFAKDDRHPYLNILKEYSYFHGRTIAILIRNGENLYLGWTDEERVHIDDDLIISQVVTEVVPDEEKKFTFESDRKKYIKQQREERKRILDGLVSRSFIYNILQGVVDNTPILPLPEGVTLSKQSEYVIYAVADKWLADSRYGSFTEIVERANEKVQAGDMLLTVQSLVPEHDSHGWSGRLYYDTYNNVRGRGVANRTRDCSLRDCTLYRANLVEYDEPVPMVLYRYPVGKDPKTGEKKWMTYSTKAESAANLSADTEILERYDEVKRHVFISAEKTDTWTRDGDRSTARSNFEVYNKEFINLTYLDSVVLEWAINSKNLGGWVIGGQAVDYAHAIRYMNTAMDFIKKREAKEKELLDAIDHTICEDAEWPHKLMEWKLEHNVRQITEYQAKRFAKSIKN